MERDSGNLFVLEGILISLILLGAAYAIRSMDDSASSDARPRSELERLTNDVLLVLNGLTDGNGTSLLDLYAAQAYHCAFDAQRWSNDCDGARSRNLTIKIDNYLPLGAGYAVGVANGFATRELYRSPLPRGEAVSSSLTFAPEWNLTFVATELSCYGAADAVNLTVVPIDHGRVAWSRWGNVTVGTTETAGAAAHTARWWNVTLPAGRPASGDVVANVTGNATFPGATAYAACDLGGLAPALRAALRDVVISGPAVAPLAAPSAFSVDLGPLYGVAGATVATANLTVYEPLPPSQERPDTYLEAGRVALAGTTARTGTWTPDSATLYGTHPALLRVGIDIGATRVEARRVFLVQVGLPTGEVPIDPPYRVTLQTWLADWG